MTQADATTLRHPLCDAFGMRHPEELLSFRSMFGGACGYADGVVFASLSDVGLALKLSVPDQDELLRIPGAKRLQYEPDAPVSRQSVVVPERMIGDVPELADWVEKSVTWVRRLPKKKR